MPGSATAFAATWRCWCCRTCSNGPGACSRRPSGQAATERVRKQAPNFCFMAEVYWDLEWTLQQQGFDYAYDKRLYDRLHERHARPVREHFHAGLDYQDKLARFMENHDEPRAAAAFPHDVHEAAALLTFLSPGLRFFHQGQFQGRRKRISPHLVRGPEEPNDQRLEHFYDRLLSRTASAGRARRRLASARVHACLGRQLELGWLRRLRVARHCRRASVGDGELCPESGPVLRAPAVPGSRQGPVAAARPDGRRYIRSRRQRSAVARTVPGRRSLAVPCLQHGGAARLESARSRVGRESDARQWT